MDIRCEYIKPIEAKPNKSSLCLAAAVSHRSM